MGGGVHVQAHWVCTPWGVLLAGASVAAGAAITGIWIVFAPDSDGFGVLVEVEVMVVVVGGGGSCVNDDVAVVDVAGAAITQ